MNFGPVSPQRFFGASGPAGGRRGKCCGFALVEIWRAETYTIREGGSVCRGGLVDHRNSGRLGFGLSQ